MRGKMIQHRDGSVSYFVEGKEVSQKEFDLAFPPKEGYLDAPPAGPSASGWPFLSDALAVHPSQIPAVMERNKKHGLYVKYDPVDGRAELADRGMRRDLMKVEAFHDNNGGYGDDHA